MRPQYGCWILSGQFSDTSNHLTESTLCTGKRGLSVSVRFRLKCKNEATSAPTLSFEYNSCSSSSFILFSFSSSPVSLLAFFLVSSSSSMSSLKVGDEICTCFSFPLPFFFPFLVCSCLFLFASAALFAFPLGGFEGPGIVVIQVKEPRLHAIHDSTLMSLFLCPNR